MLNQKGFIAFTSVLVISAVLLLTTVSVSLLGIGGLRGSLDFKKGQETLKVAESCAEEALIRTRDDTNYTGGSLSVGDGNCTINVTDSGTNKLIEIEAEITGPPSFTKFLEITAQRSGGGINILSWKEVTN